MSNALSGKMEECTSGVECEFWNAVLYPNSPSSNHRSWRGGAVLYCSALGT